MAIRKPGRNTQRWYYEDVLEYRVTELRGEYALYDPDHFYPLYTYVEDFPYIDKGVIEGFYSKDADNAEDVEFRSLKVKLFDEPPQTKQDLFNNEVASIEYEVEGNLVTIVAWQNYNWQDEWPIRLGLNYLTNCLYRPGKGIVFRVVKDPIAFWQSERFLPLGGHYDPYLVRTPLWIP